MFVYIFACVGFCCHLCNFNISVAPAQPSVAFYEHRSGVSKYLVQWDKDKSFGGSRAGGEVSHEDAAGWSAVVIDTQYQVRTYPW